MIKAIVFDLTGVLFRLEKGGDFEIIRDNFELVKSLKNKYKLGILSNLPSDYKEKLKEIGFYDIFNKINLSGETGILKPDKESYLLILQELKTSPQETLFIDDSFENIKSAKDLGMKTIHYQESENLKEIIKNNIQND